MRGKIVLAGLILGLTGAGVGAQAKLPTTTYDDIYCSGTITTESVPRDHYVVSGEESNLVNTFQEGAYVYINEGASHGVKVGDEFSVIRPVEPFYDVEWSKWQFSILKKLGQVWEDEGRVRVVVVQPDVSIAQVENSCNYIQRGDIILPFVPRPTPPVKPGASFDRFAPPSNKGTAMIITGKLFAVTGGTNNIIYVNLGNAQGVKVGDYFRIFRYTGTEHETVYQDKRVAFDVYGYGSVPLKYNWSNVPRQVIGEGVVVRTAPNASTVLVTFSLREFFVGDYVELE